MYTNSLMNRNRDVGDQNMVPGHSMCFSYFITGHFMDLNKNITWFSWLMKGAGGGCCFQCFVAVDCFLFIGSYFFAVRLQVGLNFARVSNFYSCVMLQHSSYVLNLQ